MKRFWALVLALAVLAALPGSSLAAGKMTAVQENFYVVNSYSIYGYVFARVENTGDRPVGYSAALLEIYNANGDPLASDTYPNVYGKYLQPGEYAYVKHYERVEGIESYTEVDDYSFTISGKSDSSHTTKRFACKAEYFPDLEVSKYRTENVILATFTNDSEEVVFGLDVVMALLDDEGNILDIENVNLYSSVGVNPGSSITVTAEVSSAMREAFERKGLSPTHVDAYAYAYFEAE